MNELAIQKWIVDVVKARGGFAMKMSHRFLVGVPDLLIKIPEYPAFVWEVKKNDFKKFPHDRFILPDTTVLQRRRLEEMEKAGMRAAVASFLQINNNYYLNLIKPNMVTNPVPAEGYLAIGSDIVLFAAMKAFCYKGLPG